MFAKVHKSRILGALDSGAPPSEDAWAQGILEFSTAVCDGQVFGPRRLILRNFNSDPTRGVIYELYRPEFIDVQEPHLPVRCIRPDPMGSGRLRNGARVVGGDSKVDATLPPSRAVVVAIDPHGGRTNNGSMDSTNSPAVGQIVVNLSEPQTWEKRCMRRLQEIGSLITDSHASDLAGQLHRAWPRLTPERAAEKFLLRG